eukprot:942336-Pyramimonas_sp.AAC.1
MAEALRFHWQPVFAAKKVDVAAVRERIEARMPQGDSIDVIAPAKNQLKAFLTRASPSAPGPDCLPCNAWTARDHSLGILEVRARFLCSGDSIPRDLNDPDFAFLPK